DVLAEEDHRREMGGGFDGLLQRRHVRQHTAISVVLLDGFDPRLIVLAGADLLPQGIGRGLPALTHSILLTAGHAGTRALVLGLGEGLRRARGDAWKSVLTEATRPFTPWLADLIERSSRTASDPEASVQERRDAIALLSLDEFTQARAKLAPLLEGR